MTVKYAGPKVIFSRHGVDFDNNKDDKYVYLNIAVQLFQAFSHEYNQDEVYVYDSTLKRLSDHDIMNFILSNFPDHDSLIQEAEQRAKSYFEHEMQVVENQKEMLDSVEYETWIKNVELMKKYVLQRHFNKNLYYFLINKIAELIKKHSIKQIHLPMFQNFIHVLHSIQGSLKQTRNSRQSNIKIYEKNSTLMASLEID